MNYNLTELKNRLTYLIITFISLSFISFLYKESLLYFIVKSSLFQIKNELPFFIYTNLMEVFLTYLKLSILTGIYLTLPFFFFHAWLFFSPGFYKSEYKSAKKLFSICGSVWVLNNFFIYNFLVPWIWNFFLKFGKDSSKSPLSLCFEIKLNDYVEFLLITMIYCSLASQFLFIFILWILNKNQDNLFSIKQIRHYVYIFVFAFATLVTPPDVVSQLILGLPIITIYELLTLILLIKNEYFFKISQTFNS